MGLCRALGPLGAHHDLWRRSRVRDEFAMHQQASRDIAQWRITRSSYAPAANWHIR